MTTRKPSQAAFLYSEAGKFGRDASFAANVILTSHRSPARKLRGLLRLLRRGIVVRTAAYDMDILLADGRRIEWSSLEHVS